MKRITNLLLWIVGTMFILGCAHQVTLRTTIQPNALIAKKLPKTVAVIFSGEMPTYVESVKPSSFAGSAHTYNFELGKALCPALFRSVETVYDKVILSKSIQPQDQYDGIIKFSLANSNMDVYFQEGFLSSTAKANCSISVTIEAYDNSGKLLRKTTVNGSGFSSKGTDVFSANKSFAAAAETAIQQIADNVANLLISGFAEEQSGK